MPTSTASCTLPTRRISVAIFVLLFFVYSYINHGDVKADGEYSRLALLHSLVVHQQWNIDRYHFNTTDKAKYKGHFYSEKAPGTTIVAFPSFIVGMSILRMFNINVESTNGWMLSGWITLIGSLAWITALGGVFLFLALQRIVGKQASLLTTLAIFLGSTPLPFSTMLYDHSLVISLLVFSLYIAENPVKIMKVTSRWPSWLSTQVSRDRVAGYCIGLAAASEYTAYPVIAGIVLYFLAKDYRRFQTVCINALLPFSTVFIYNYIIFESPFSISYQYSNHYAEHHQYGFFGVRIFNFERLWTFLFGTNKGLFFWTPFLLLSLPGFLEIKKKDPKMFWYFSLISLFQIFLFAGYKGFGGPSITSRYYSCILPLLAYPSAFGCQKFPRLGFALAGISMVLTGIGTVVSASSKMRYTFFDLHLPLFLSGKLWATNLGKLLGLPGLWSLVPLIVFIVGMLYILWRLGGFSSARIGNTEG